MYLSVFSLLGDSYLERLGNGSVAITMEIYSHVLPNMQEKAALTIDEAMIQK